MKSDAEMERDDALALARSAITTADGLLDLLAECLPFIDTELVGGDLLAARVEKAIGRVPA